MKKSPKSILAFLLAVILATAGLTATTFAGNAADTGKGTLLTGITAEPLSAGASLLSAETVADTTAKTNADTTADASLSDDTAEEMPVTVLADPAAPTLSTAMEKLSAEVPLLMHGTPGEDVSFDISDFKKALGVSRIGSITVKSLPDVTSGTLFLSNLRVSTGQTVKADNLSLLHFSPAGELTKSAEFTFTCDDCAGGAEILCRIQFSDRENHAPTVSGITEESLSVTTQKSIAVYGKMQAVDPDGDDLVYQIVSYPKKGILTVTDAGTGRFRYTPVSGYTGRDSFTYVARDSYGAYSGLSKVTITVRKPDAELTYADMAENVYHNAAVTITAAGIMEGKTKDGQLSFSPDETVSRQDFAVMLMKIAGIPVRPYQRTSFEDNASISEEYRSYIATAQVLGFVNGSLTDEGLVFRPTEAVTRAEAAAMICRVFGITLPDSVATFAADSAVPVWAAPAMTVLSEKGILTVGSGQSAVSALCRGETAQILCRLISESK